MAAWLSSHTPLWQPRVLLGWILGVDPAPLNKLCEVAFHIAELEGSTTRIYNYVLRGFGRRRQKKNRVAIHDSSGSIFKKKKKALE